MRISRNDRAGNLGWFAQAFWLPWLGALALGAGGCSSTASRPETFRDPAQQLVPKITEIMAGPAGGMLTNLDGYHGEFVLILGATAEDRLTATGQLYARDGKLCFEAVFRKPARRAPDSGAFTLVWDTRANQGFVISESMQGYAPLGLETASMNTTAGTNSAGATGLQVERAKDLNGLATRITSTDSSPPYVLTLSGIKPALPGPEKFILPDGYTKYGSEGAMLGELAVRQRALAGAGGERDRDELGPYISQPGAQQPHSVNSPGYSP